MIQFLWVLSFFFNFLVRAFTDLVTLASSFIMYVLLSILNPHSIELLTSASGAVYFLMVNIVQSLFSPFDVYINEIVRHDAANIFSSQAITYLIIGVFMIASTDALITLMPILLEAATTVIRYFDLFGKRGGQPTRDRLLRNIRARK